MSTGTFPDAWEEVALVTIQKLGGTAYQFMTVTDEVSPLPGDYPGESIPNLAGGRIWKQSPQEDGEVTLKLYPLSIDTTTGDNLFQQFEGGTWDTSQPLATVNAWPAGVSRVRDKFMIAIMWTDDAAQASAATATTTTDSVALRFHVKEARFISLKTEYTDKMLISTATFKFPAMNKAGTYKTYQWESTNAGGTAQAPLPALTYSTSL